jgi:hypothetical protein
MVIAEQYGQFLVKMPDVENIHCTVHLFVVGN